MTTKTATHAAIAAGIAALLPTLALAQPSQPGDPLQVLSKSFNAQSFSSDGKASGNVYEQVTCPALKGTNPQLVVQVMSVNDEREAYEKAQPQLETQKAAIRKYCTR